MFVCVAGIGKAEAGGRKNVYLSALTFRQCGVGKCVGEESFSAAEAEAEALVRVINFTVDR